MIPELTIIVPAYKGRTLLETLKSIESQTSREFRLLVVDDGSPDDIESIVSTIPSAEYIRFSENLGGRDLVGHWNRCVELACTKYVWLFSDDDIMDPTCVESFLNELVRNPGYRVFRFNTRVDNLETGVIEDNPMHPPLENGMEFLIAKISGQRNSYMPEYLFAKDAFDENNRSFVRFPFAWNSDDASWGLFAGNSRIRTIAGPRVTWRLGGGNISSDTGNSVWKAAADLEFSIWAHARFGISRLQFDRMRTHRIRHHYTLPLRALRSGLWWKIAKGSSLAVFATLLWSTLLGLRFRTRVRSTIRSARRLFP